MRRETTDSILYTIGALVTVFTLVMASTKIGKKGASKSMNNWFRARVIAQGATVAAIIGGSYVYGNTKKDEDAKALAEELRLKEKAEFEARLKAAEEAHAMEEAMRRKAEEDAKASRGFWRWLSWSSQTKDGSRTTTSPAPEKAAPAKKVAEEKA